MKKIIFCLAAVMMLAACNNKTENENNTNEASEPQKVERRLPTASPNDKGHDEWTKQTTIMSSKPMVIDFFATWCGPCKKLVPILDKIEQNHKGEVIFKRIDVDEETALALEFNVQSIPTLMFITPKGEYKTLVGLQEPEVIEAKIAELLKQSSN